MNPPMQRKVIKLGSNSLLVTNETMTKLSVGGIFIADVRSIGMTFTAGGGGQSQSSSSGKRSSIGYLTTSVGQKIPISGYLAGVLGGSFNAVFSGASQGLSKTSTSGALSTGFTIDAPRLSADVKLSRIFVPQADPFWSADFSAGYKFNTHFRADLNLGSPLFRNIEGKMPYTVGLKLSFTR